MIRLKTSNARYVDRIFMLALLVLFAITSFLVVSIGAKQYQSTVDTLAQNQETRSVTAYLQEKINQHDTSNSVVICTVGEADALRLTEFTDNQEYHTYIYAYNGYLWEASVSSLTAVAPGNGEPVMKVTNLTIEEFPGMLFCFHITDKTGSSYPFYLSINAK